MRVLIACEFSGIVREAFAARGHDAWSCDLVPTERPGQHILGDVREHLYDGWDLMIAHPPCTYLSAAGLHFCKGNKERMKKRGQAAAFVMEIMAAPIERIAIENPVGYLSTALRKPDQVVYMNDFGHPEARKPTCLWLKNLPALKATKSVPHIKSKGGGRRESEWYRKTKSARLRSLTFKGFAQAMADQWTTRPTKEAADE